MRLMARAAARASLPLKHSQGFNPRPRLALVPPRPVGVASRCELMVIQLTEPIDAETLCRKLNEQLPRGQAPAVQTLPPGPANPLRGVPGPNRIDSGGRTHRRIGLYE